jgi:site-specific DNA-methyltransferase (cytosine-N4-specific)
MFVGMAEDRLGAYPLSRIQGRVQLIFTSPPFPLNTKKKYGNLQGQEYLKWLERFAPIFAEQLTSDGSIVIEIGNAWVPRSPTMSTLPLESLLAFKKAAGLHLCQEFIGFNPTRLPTPAQWVNVERVRVKDAFTRLWWLSPTDRPKANNREVLTQYSEAMKTLLRRGTYNAGRRPGGYVIGKTSFLTDHGGAIPPNVLLPRIEEMLPELTEVLSMSNVRSNDPYQVYCREHGIQAHPARMPSRLVEFFIRFLTEPGDLVLDPFAGSNTTGATAQRLKRNWVAIEADREYATASHARFSEWKVHWHSKSEEPPE